MDEKKVKQEEKKVKKPTYEELENFAKQLSSQCEMVVKENNQLKEALQRMNANLMFTELEFRFKVLQNAEMFDTDFVEFCVKAIEEVMTPEKEEKKEEE